MAGGARTTELVCLFWLLSCAPSQVGLDSLQKNFARAEYIATGDGWAEARRRRLLERYLQQSGFVVSAEQQRFSDNRRESKYRQVVLHAQRPAHGNAGKKLTLTLSLLPPAQGALSADFAARQRECDRSLFSVLSDLAQFTALDFVSSPSCLGLTTQTGAGK